MSRRKEEHRRRARRAVKRVWLLAILLLVGAFVVLAFTKTIGHAQNKTAIQTALSTRLLSKPAPDVILTASITSGPNFRVDYQYGQLEAKNLFQTLLAAAKNEKSYPEFMRVEIASLDNPRMNLRPVESFFADMHGRKNPLIFAWSTHIGGTNTLFVSLPRLMYEVKKIHPLPEGQIDPYMENFVAASLVHELIHFELSQAQWDIVPKLDEEDRTWNRVGKLVFMPLRQNNQPLPQGWIDADDVMKGCGYKTGCPDFREFMTSNRLSQ